MFRAIALAALLAAPLAACGAPETETGSFVEATEAFIITPPEGRDVTMGGVEIAAHGAGYTLIGAEADMAERVELHTMAMEDGMMRMRQVESFAVPPGETRILERGGDHLMFFGLTDPLVPGETTDVRLEFQTEDGEEITLSVEAEIRALGED